MSLNLIFHEVSFHKYSVVLASSLNCYTCFRITETTVQRVRTQFGRSTHPGNLLCISCCIELNSIKTSLQSAICCKQIRGAWGCEIGRLFTFTVCTVIDSSVFMICLKVRKYWADRYVTVSSRLKVCWCWRLLLTTLALPMVQREIICQTIAMCMPVCSHGWRFALLLMDIVVPS